MPNDAWITDDKYVGFDRRKGGSGTRIFDRRRHAGARTEPPALSTMMRQLKSAALGLSGRSQWDRFEVRLEGAIGLASMQGQRRCADELSRLLNDIRRVHPRPYPAAGVEEALARAAAALPP